MVVRPTIRRGRHREARIKAGVRVGRRGRVSVLRNGVRVKDRELVLALVGRKI